MFDPQIWGYYEWILINIKLKMGLINVLVYYYFEY